MTQRADHAAVDLYWIPLGAGGHFVRFNGEVYEAIAAARRGRPRRDLYHTALVVEVDGARHTIELAPSPDAGESDRGVVGTGPVGDRRLGRWRLFRYELRCWRGGEIPDLALAVGGPRRLTGDAEVARRVLDAVPHAPRPVWGRDELGVGEGWTCNSVVAWVLVAAGLHADSLRPPLGGRAPGWDAGVAVALRVFPDRRSGASRVEQGGGDGWHGVAVKAACASTSQPPARRSHEQVLQVRRPRGQHRAHRVRRRRDLHRHRRS